MCNGSESETNVLLCSSNMQGREGEELCRRQARSVVCIRSIPLPRDSSRFALVEGREFNYDLEREGAEGV